MPIAGPLRLARRAKREAAARLDRQALEPLGPCGDDACAQFQPSRK
jgi:hypothetical protein